MTEINMTDVGATATAIVRSVDPKQYEGMKKPLRDANAAGRGLQEMVELALAFGLSPTGVLSAVVDALYNESRKAGLYPSEYAPKGNDILDRLVELADMKLMLEHLRDISGVTVADVDLSVDVKLHKLRQWADEGNMVMKNGTIYRRGVR